MAENSTFLEEEDPRVGMRFAEVYVRIGPVDSRSFMSRTEWEQGVASRKALRDLAANAVDACAGEIERSPQRFQRWLESMTQKRA